MENSRYRWGIVAAGGLLGCVAVGGIQAAPDPCPAGADCGVHAGPDPCGAGVAESLGSTRHHGSEHSRTSG